MHAVAANTRPKFSAEGHSIRSGEINPLFKVGGPLLALGEILFQAVFRAELLVRKPMTDKTEASVAYFTARLSLSDRGICIFAHS